MTPELPTDEGFAERLARVIRESVELRAYDRQWPESFRRERDHLRVCLPPELIGHLERAQAPLRVHPGAIYMHEGQQYAVQTLDRDGGSATVAPKPSTHANTSATVSPTA